ncbi:MAG: beta-hydroxyacyl-ACP dehydratase [Firmicutes bacterium]|nr:beta-hydroxyacyl-ACP dehydratase [Bacillota bacterium]
MNKQEIMNILPHRDNMLLVEEAEIIEEEGKDGEMHTMSHGKYHVRGDEFFLQGHFPGNPIVPGVILCEMLAQSTCVLLQSAMEEGMTSLFTGLKEVKFKNPVRPGDTFETKCEITKSKPPFYFAKGKGFVNGKVAVQAEFSFALVKEK